MIASPVPPLSLSSFFLVWIACQFRPFGMGGIERHQGAIFFGHLIDFRHSCFGMGGIEKHDGATALLRPGEF